MKPANWLIASRIIVLLLSLVAFLPQPAHAASHPILIHEWQVKWIPAGTSSDLSPTADGFWEDVTVSNPLTIVPKNTQGMWVRFTVPATSDWERPGLLVDRLYGLDLSVYQDEQSIYASSRDFSFDLNKLLVPIKQSDEAEEYYIRILTTNERAGIISGIRVDNFEQLSDRFVLKDLPDILLGTSIAFLSLIMFISSGYLRQKQRSSWISLCLIALTTGTLFIVYSPLPYIYLRDYGSILMLLFDISLFILIPALNHYIDQIYEGHYRFFTIFRYIQAGYSAFCLIALIVYTASGQQNYEVYYVILNVIMSILILLQLPLIIVLSILNAIRGNKNATILSAGFILFALSGTIDLIFYYLSNKTYVLFLWKFGVIILMVSLIIILARRISSDYAKLVSYSKELELYNHSMQRTEKMKIISDLAASVAHEVRNPLQVTRGFLQLLAARTDQKSQAYFELAVNELDRASDIITDFLTFAKPEIERITLLDLSQEIKKIEAMMLPMAAMHGGILTCIIQDELYIHGNSSKLKQALINIIKNGIEAIGSDGTIQIEATAAAGKVQIRISDNGDGMSEDEVAKLGEPFFSTKTKGTGLGLMVTFRIIEVMKGTISIKSTKGKGTEFIIRFPLIVKEKLLPGESHV